MEDGVSSERERRERALGELDDVIRGTQDWLDDVLSDMGWSQAHLLQKDEDLMPCPHDPHHLMPAHALDKHTKMCAYRKHGYTRDQLEEIFSEDQSKDGKDRITIDDPTFFRIINSVQPGTSDMQRPLNVERERVELSEQQRAALYRHCIQVARSRHLVVSFPEDELTPLEDQRTQDATKGMTDLERKAYERDTKRRRQSYRGKSSHSGNKSHHEILRDLIISQMDILSHMWNTDSSTEARGQAENDDRDKKRREEKEEERDRERIEERERGRIEKDRGRIEERDRERIEERERGRIEKDRGRIDERDRGRAETSREWEERDREREEERRPRKDRKDRDRSSRRDEEGSSASSSRKHKKHHKHKSKKSRRGTPSRDEARD